MTGVIKGMSVVDCDGTTVDKVYRPWGPLHDADVPLIGSRQGRGNRYGHRQLRAEIFSLLNHLDYIKQARP
jgi:hypothetical protein